MLDTLNPRCARRCTPAGCSGFADTAYTHRDRTTIKDRRQSTALHQEMAGGRAEDTKVPGAFGAASTAGLAAAGHAAGVGPAFYLGVSASAPSRGKFGTSTWTTARIARLSSGQRDAVRGDRLRGVRRGAGGVLRGFRGGRCSGVGGAGWVGGGESVSVVDGVLMMTDSCFTQRLRPIAGRRRRQFG